MAAEKIKKTADGKWEWTGEVPDGAGVVSVQTFVADTKEEAERLAKAYLERVAGKKPVAKQVARSEQAKAKTGLLSK